MRDELNGMELVDRYLDGAMSAEEWTSFEARLKESAELRTLVDDQRALREGLERMPVRAAAIRAKRQWAWRKWKPWIGGGLLAIIVAGGVILFPRPAEQSLQEQVPINVPASDSEEPTVNSVIIHAGSDTVVDTIYHIIRRSEYTRADSIVIPPKEGSNDPDIRPVSGEPAQPTDAVEEQEIDNQGFAVLSTQGGMPSYPGGLKALHRYLQQAIRVPEDAQRGGKVMIRFVVDEQGRIGDVTLVKGLGNACDQEAIRVVKTMPAWTPATQDGKPIKSELNMPLIFALQ